MQIHPSMNYLGKYQMNQGFFLHKIISLSNEFFFILSVFKFSFFKFYLSYLRIQCLGLPDVLIMYICK